MWCSALDAAPLYHRAAAAHQPNKEQYDGDDQQHVDELADRVRPDDSQEPGDQQNDCDGVQHGDLSLFTPSSLAPANWAEALHASTHFSMRQSPEDVCAFEYMCS
jgi:hypothetical protein